MGNVWEDPIVVGLTSLLLCLLLAWFFDIQNSRNSSSLEKNDDISVGLRRESVFQRITALMSANDHVLSATEWRKFKLASKVMASHNTILLRFEVPGGKALNLPIGKHLSVRAKIEGNFVQRAYTPISDEKGVVVLSSAPTFIPWHRFIIPNPFPKKRLF